MSVADGFFFGLGLFLAYILVRVIGSLFTLPERDDTDPPDGRSNLKLLIEHRTGCHYLAHKNALTPRLDTNGQQICEKQTK